MQILPSYSNEQTPGLEWTRRLQAMGPNWTDSVLFPLVEHLGAMSSYQEKWKTTLWLAKRQNPAQPYLRTPLSHPAPHHCSRFWKTHFSLWNFRTRPFGTWWRQDAYRLLTSWLGGAGRQFWPLPAPQGAFGLGFRGALQLTNFLQTLPSLSSFSRPLVVFEEYCSDSGVMPHTLSANYDLLITPSEPHSLECIREWEQDLGTSFNTQKNKHVLRFKYKSSICRKMQETNFKILTRGYRMLARLKMFFPRLPIIFWSYPKSLQCPIPEDLAFLGCYGTYLSSLMRVEPSLDATL